MLRHIGSKAYHVKAILRSCILLLPLTSQDVALACDDASAVVRGMYKQVMDRDPDPGGYNANVTYLPRADVKTLIRSQVLSPEYRNNFINGHSPDDVVMVLYKKPLGATVNARRSWRTEMGKRLSSGWVGVYRRC